MKYTCQKLFLSITDLSSLLLFFSRTLIPSGTACQNTRHKNYLGFRKGFVKAKLFFNFWDTLQRDIKLLRF